jgi:hypothetical protein
VRSPIRALSSVPRTPTVPVHVGALVPTLLLALLAACARSSPGRGTGAAGRGGVSSSAVSASAGGGAGSVSRVSCSGNSCSMTLAGSGSRVHVLGTTFGLAAIDGDRVTLRVDGRDVTCDLERSVAVGALRLTCTAVTDHTVTFTVVRG